MKRCTACGWHRPFGKFAEQRMKSGAYCFTSECVDCRRARDRARYHADSGAKRAKRKTYREANADAVADYQRNYFDRNAGLNAFYCAKRRSDVQRASVAWADTAAIRRIYEEASAAGLTVDHVVPLNGKLVCGLHVEYNLQLMTGPANSAKGNRYA